MPTHFEYMVDRRNRGLEVIPERVVCAANRFPNGSIVLGVRHGCQIMLAQAKAMGLVFHESDDGFYTNWQRWVNRTDAMVIAREQGQVFREDGTHNPDVLYSECLY